jgi:hypothetical protein
MADAEKERRFKNLAMVLANDATMGLYPMAASWLVSGDDDYDERLAEARGKVDQARSELSDFDQNLALGGSIVAPLGMGVAGRVAREMAPASKAAWAAGQATRPVVIGGAGALGSYDPRLTPEEQKRQYVLGAAGAFLPAKIGSKFPEAMDWARFAYDSLPAPRPKGPRPRIEPALPIPASRTPDQVGGGQRVSGAPQSPPRTPQQPTSEAARGRLADRVKASRHDRPDPKALLAEMEDLQRQLDGVGEAMSSAKYSRNREHLSADPNSLQTRLQQGPKPYSGKRAPDREEMRQMQMAHGEFRAAIEQPAALYKAGQITEAQFNSAAQQAVIKAARGNNVDPGYLVKQIAKDQRRDPLGWSLTFPDKKD